MKLLNLPEFLCPNLFRWMLRLPKNTLQHSSDFQASDFSCWLFIVYTKLQQLNFILSAFEVLSKLRKDTCGKIKGTLPYFTSNSIDQNLLLFWFSLFKFVEVVAAPKRMDTPTSKKYVTANQTPFRWTKIRVLNSGGTPPYLLLKNNNKTTICFDFQAPAFYCWLFIVAYTTAKQTNKQTKKSCGKN